MQIGSIIKAKQPEMYYKLLKLKKSRLDTGDRLTTKDFERMMRHDGYKRVGSVIRQVRHG